ncbi:hypothetical protein RE735_03065 [Bacillus aerius]|uniref:hypothetical protein n=1 Tax=Bacillus aerius TaxID=293388 RepID=UPI0028151E9A|nr:hypothetical protein [Bacillus aerius]WMT29564.1 hypothetical protein RE735_03065 [Bacillus aerius]
MKKLITMPFLVLLLGVMLTACGTSNQSNDNNADNSKKETTEAADQKKENATDEKTEDKSASEKADDASKDTAAQSDEEAKESSSKEITKEGTTNDQSQAESKTKKNEVTKEGTYVGLADGHTIAVNIDGKEVAIQFGNTFSKQVNSLKEESKVKVTYTKDANGTLRLKTIESVKAK